MTMWTTTTKASLSALVRCPLPSRRAATTRQRPSRSGTTTIRRLRWSSGKRPTQSPRAARPPSKVTLSADPERTVVIPVTKTANQGGATAEDYSGVPASVTFNSGQTSRTFTFTAAQDTVDDDGESVKLDLRHAALRG